jgi:pimeloyl-ACP methyl ester carboxylesterase
MASCVLLIHGAYQGSWIWERTTLALRSRGAEVLAPSLDGCAERSHQLRPGISTESHADELAELLRLHDWHEVTLVGTSTGGMVACALAERVRDRVSRIVLADALALFDGESLPDIVTRRNSVDTPLGSAPSVEDARERLFAELDDETRDWALERYSLQPINVMTAPVSNRVGMRTWFGAAIARTHLARTLPERPTNLMPGGMSWIPATIRCCRPLKNWPTLSSGDRWAYFGLALSAHAPRQC